MQHKALVFQNKKSRGKKAKSRKKSRNNTFVAETVKLYGPVEANWLSNKLAL